MRLDRSLPTPSQSKTILTFPLFSSHLLLFITIKSIFLKWLGRHSWWVSAGNCYKNVASPLSNRSTAALLMLLQLSSSAFVKSVFFKNVVSLHCRGLPAYAPVAQTNLYQASHSTAQHSSATAVDYGGSKCVQMCGQCSQRTQRSQCSNIAT